VVARLTVPFQIKHPGIRFSVLSRTSAEILQLLQNFEIDAGISYLDNEPLGHVRTVPLYGERYTLLTSTEGPLAGRASVTWAEVARLPLCLLTPDMQNRRILDQMLRQAGAPGEPTLVSNSTILLLSHVKTGRWSTILPPSLVETLGLPHSICAIPIVDPALTHAVGLVVPQREPATPAVAALVAEARGLARAFDGAEPHA
jgi:DNA-binding transcriptional LysR family regulator